MNAFSEYPARTGAKADAIRVLVVDDSAVIRGLVCRWLEEDGEITVVARASNGEVALRQAREHHPDVVVLDIEMPVMDGMTALKKMLADDAGLKVLMSSTLTQRNAEISMQALSAGAADYVAKPSATVEMTGTMDFRRELIGKVKALAAASRMRPRGSGSTTAKSAGGRAPVSVARRPEGGLYGKSPISLRRWNRMLSPKVIAIGSSTGGPQALMELVKVMAGKVKQPIVITQHMPPTFTKILAEHLRRIHGEGCAEAQDGEILKGGHIYLAPGDFHLTVQVRGGQPKIALEKGPPENFCRPAVDPMFRSLAKAYGGAVLGVVLTGMGHDGLSGGQAIVAAGGAIVAQDEASSVVWGMPGAVATGGLCSAVLPLREIGPTICRLANGGGL
ncbi:MAG: chemotaxis response regulator protein-glutamate methylesterase [Alphaproteobacteria bacterium]